MGLKIKPTGPLHAYRQARSSADFVAGTGFESLTCSMMTQCICSISWPINAVSDAAKEGNLVMVARDKEKHAAYMREWRIRNPGYANEALKSWRLQNPDKMAAIRERAKSKIMLDPSIKARRNAGHAEYKKRNRQKVNAYLRMYRAKKLSITLIRHKPEDVMRAVTKAVSPTLPRWMRDDIISSMLLAVLEGELMLENVASRAKDYLSRYNKQNDHFKTLSLNSTVGSGEGRTQWIDLLPDQNGLFNN